MYQSTLPSVVFDDNIVITDRLGEIYIPKQPVDGTHPHGILGGALVVSMDKTAVFPRNTGLMYVSDGDGSITGVKSPIDTDYITSTIHNAPVVWQAIHENSVNPHRKDVTHTRLWDMALVEYQTQVMNGGGLAPMIPTGNATVVYNKETGEPIQTINLRDKQIYYMTTTGPEPGTFRIKTPLIQGTPAVDLEFLSGQVPSATGRLNPQVANAFTNGFAVLDISTFPASITMLAVKRDDLYPSRLYITDPTFAPHEKGIPIVEGDIRFEYTRYASDMQWLSIPEQYSASHNSIQISARVITGSNVDSSGIMAYSTVAANAMRGTLGHQLLALASSFIYRKDVSSSSTLFSLLQNIRFAVTSLNKSFNIGIQELLASRPFQTRLINAILASNGPVGETNNAGLVSSIKIRPEYADMNIYMVAKNVIVPVRVGNVVRVVYVGNVPIIVRLENYLPTNPAITYNVPARDDTTLNTPIITQLKNAGHWGSQWDASGVGESHMQGLAFKTETDGFISAHYPPYLFSSNPVLTNEVILLQDSSGVSICSGMTLSMVVSSLSYSFGSSADNNIDVNGDECITSLRIAGIEGTEMVMYIIRKPDGRLNTKVVSAEQILINMTTRQKVLVSSSSRTVTVTLQFLQSALYTEMFIDGVVILDMETEATNINSAGGVLLQEQIRVVGMTLGTFYHSSGSVLSGIKNFHGTIKHIHFDTAVLKDAGARRYTTWAIRQGLLEDVNALNFPAVVDMDAFHLCNNQNDPVAVVDLDVQVFTYTSNTLRITKWKNVGASAADADASGVCLLQSQYGYASKPWQKYVELQQQSLITEDGGGGGFLTVPIDREMKSFTVIFVGRLKEHTHEQTQQRILTMNMSESSVNISLTHDKQSNAFIINALDHPPIVITNSYVPIIGMRHIYALTVNRSDNGLLQIKLFIDVAKTPLGEATMILSSTSSPSDYFQISSCKVGHELQTIGLVSEIHQFQIFDCDLGSRGNTLSNVMSFLNHKWNLPNNTLRWHNNGEGGYELDAVSVPNSFQYYSPEMRLNSCLEQSDFGVLMSNNGKPAVSYYGTPSIQITTNPFAIQPILDFAAFNLKNEPPLMQVNTWPNTGSVLRDASGCTDNTNITHKPTVQKTSNGIKYVKFSKSFANYLYLPSIDCGGGSGAAADIRRKVGLTYIAVVKFDGDGDETMLDLSGNMHQISLRRTNSSLYSSVRLNNSTTLDSSGGMPLIGVWHTVAWVFEIHDNNSISTKWYIDRPYQGVEEGMGISFKSFAVSDDSPLIFTDNYFGRRNNAGNEEDYYYFDGDLSRFMLYDLPLTYSQITDVFHHMRALNMSSWLPQIDLNASNLLNSVNNTVTEWQNVGTLSSKGGDARDCFPGYYPPGPLTGVSTVLSGYQYGNGLYQVTSNTGVANPHMVFNYDITDIWTSTGYYFLDNVWHGPNVSINNTVYQGPSIVIQLPSSIQLYSFTITSPDINVAPRSFQIFGSTDGNNWTPLYNWVDSNEFSSSLTQTCIVTSSTLYNYFMYIPTQIYAATGQHEYSVCELRLYSSKESQTTNPIRKGDSTLPFVEFTADNKQYLQLSPFHLSIPRGFTLLIVAKFEEVINNSSNTILYLKDTTSTVGITFGKYSNTSSLFGSICPMVGGSIVSWVTDTTSIDTQWHIYAWKLTVDSVSNTFENTLYIDNVASPFYKSTTVGIVMPDQLPTLTMNYIGRDHSNEDTKYLNGNISHIQLYNEPLSVEQLNALFSQIYSDLPILSLSESTTSHYQKYISMYSSPSKDPQPRPPMLLLDNNTYNKSLHEILENSTGVSTTYDGLAICFVATMRHGTVFSVNNANGSPFGLTMTLNKLTKQLLLSIDFGENRKNVMLNALPFINNRHVFVIHISVETDWPRIAVYVDDLHHLVSIVSLTKNEEEHTRDMLNNYSMSVLKIGGSGNIVAADLDLHQFLLFYSRPGDHYPGQQDMISIVISIARKKWLVPEIPLIHLDAMSYEPLESNGLSTWTSTGTKTGYKGHIKYPHKLKQHPQSKTVSLSFDTVGQEDDDKYLLMLPSPWITEHPNHLNPQEDGFTIHTLMRNLPHGHGLTIAEIKFNEMIMQQQQQCSYSLQKDASGNIKFLMDTPQTGLLEWLPKKGYFTRMDDNWCLLTLTMKNINSHRQKGCEVCLYRDGQIFDRKALPQTMLLRSSRSSIDTVMNNNLKLFAPSVGSIYDDADGTNIEIEVRDIRVYTAAQSSESIMVTHKYLTQKWMLPPRPIINLPPSGLLGLISNSDGLRRWMNDAASGEDFDWSAILTTAGATIITSGEGAPFTTAAIDSGGAAPGLVLHSIPKMTWLNEEDFFSVCIEARIHESTPLETEYNIVELLDASGRTCFRWSAAAPSTGDGEDVTRCYVGTNNGTELYLTDPLQHAPYQHIKRNVWQTFVMRARMISSGSRSRSSRKKQLLLATRVADYEVQRRYELDDPPRFDAHQMTIGRNCRKIDIRSVKTYMGGGYHNSLDVTYGDHGITFYHPDGRPWRIVNNELCLSSGTHLSISIFKDQQVTNHEQGWVSLRQDDNNALHVYTDGAGIVLKSHEFIANDNRFSWLVIGAGTQVLLYTDMNGGCYVGYDEGIDRIVLVPKTETQRRVYWRCDPLPLSCHVLM